MYYLIAGILVWSIVHFIPVLAPGLRWQCVGKVGEYGFKGVFTFTDYCCHFSDYHGLESDAG